MPALLRCCRAPKLVKVNERVAWLPKTCINSNLMHFWWIGYWKTIIQCVKEPAIILTPPPPTRKCVPFVRVVVLYFDTWWRHLDCMIELYNVLSLLRNVNTHPVEDHGCDEESPSIPGWKSNWGIGSREGWVESYLDMAISRWKIGTLLKDYLIVVCKQHLIWLD